MSEGSVSPGGEDASGLRNELSGIPDNAIPYLTASVKYTSDAWMAMFLGGDWDQAEASYAEMLAQQTQWFGAAVAASSHAACETDYYAAGLPVGEEAEKK